MCFNSDVGKRNKKRYCVHCKFQVGHSFTQSMCPKARQLEDCGESGECKAYQRTWWKIWRQKGDKSGVDMAYYMLRLRENWLFRKFPCYYIQYVLMLPFIKRAFPFNHIKKGQNVIQVGCAEWLLNAGVSQALMLSAIVGRKGQVLVIDPDYRNHNALYFYMVKWRIRNIHIIPCALGKEEGWQDFLFYNDRSSTNILCEGQEKIKDHPDLPSDYLKRPTKTREVRVSTIDRIVEENGPFDFVNITTNGTEFDIIQGAKNNMNMTFAFPFAWLRGWGQAAIDYLKGYGYRVELKDAPYTTLSPNGFLGKKEMLRHDYAVAIKGDK